MLASAHRSPATPLDEGRRLVASLIDGWNAHDLDRVTDLYAADYEEDDVGQSAPQRGSDSVRRIMAYYLRAFPDVRVTLEDAIYAGDRIALAWTFRGTHQGHFMNIPPTGRAVAIRGASLITVEGGKIKRAFRMWDMAGLLRSVGLLPEL
jgi:steroid delta-isomerase-like uncharacterized protein